MTMVAILVAPGGLLVAIVGLATVLALYQRQRKRALRQREQPANGLHPTVPSEASPRISQQQQRDPELSLQDDDEYPHPNNKQPDLIHPKRGKVGSWRLSSNQLVSDFGYQNAFKCKFFQVLRVILYLIRLIILFHLTAIYSYLYLYRLLSWTLHRLEIRDMRSEPDHMPVANRWERDRNNWSKRQPLRSTQKLLCNTH